MQSAVIILIIPDVQHIVIIDQIHTLDIKELTHIMIQADVK